MPVEAKRKYRFSGDSKKLKLTTTAQSRPGGWKAIRPDAFEIKNYSSYQASYLPSIPAFKLAFLFRTF